MSKIGSPFSAVAIDINANCFDAEVLGQLQTHKTKSEIGSGSEGSPVKNSSLLNTQQIESKFRS